MNHWRRAGHYFVLLVTPAITCRGTERRWVKHHIHIYGQSQYIKEQYGWNRGL
jgi:hypothetical protein